MSQIKCPSNTFLCMEDIQKIVNDKNGLKDFENSINPNKCPTIFDNKFNNKYKCDDLFSNLVEGKTSCKELFDMLVKLNKTDVNQLKTQIKYNLAQIIQSRLKIKAVKEGPAFGTFDWWKRFIWGINKIQNYIYILSFAIVFILIVSYTFSFISNFNSISSIAYTLILAIVLLVIIMYYSFRDPVKYSIPSNKSIYQEKTKQKYPKDIQEKMETSGGNDITLISIFIPIGLVGLLVFCALIAKFAGNSSLSKMITGLAIYSFAGVILSINMFYTFLIPQFMIIGIILQKILSTKFMDSKLNGVMDITIIIILMLISWYGINLSDDNQPYLPNYSECKGEKYRKVNKIFFQYLFLVIILIIIVLLKYLDLYDTSKFVKRNRNYGLFMEPIFYAVESTFRNFVAK